MIAGTGNRLEVVVALVLNMSMSTACVLRRPNAKALRGAEMILSDLNVALTISKFCTHESTSNKVINCSDIACMTVKTSHPNLHACGNIDGDIAITVFRRETAHNVNGVDRFDVNSIFVSLREQVPFELLTESTAFTSSHSDAGENFGSGIPSCILRPFLRTVLLY